MVIYVYIIKYGSSSRTKYKSGEFHTYIIRYTNVHLICQYFCLLLWRKLARISHYLWIRSLTRSCAQQYPSNVKGVLPHRFDLLEIRVYYCSTPIKLLQKIVFFPCQCIVKTRMHRTKSCRSGFSCSNVKNTHRWSQLTTTLTLLL